MQERSEISTPTEVSRETPVFDENAELRKGYRDFFIVVGLGVIGTPLAVLGATIVLDHFYGK